MNKKDLLPGNVCRLTAIEACFTERTRLLSAETEGLEANELIVALTSMLTGDDKTTSLDDVYVLSSHKLTWIRLFGSRALWHGEDIEVVG